MHIAASSPQYVRREEVPADVVEREKNERLEYDELTKSPSASALFNKDEVSGLPARRSREQFEKFVIPGFTIALLLGEAGGHRLLLLYQRCTLLER